MSTLNSFDPVAPFYDRLARLVFGSTIRDAQLVHLPDIKQASTILILGGGTGWILKDLLNMNRSGNIVYVEASAKMILLAKQNVPFADRHRVTFMHATHDSLNEIATYDAVIINFFADMFTTVELTQIIQRLRTLIASDGILICTDFVSDSTAHKMLLEIMYTFFRVATGLRTKKLPPWRDIIMNEQFRRVRTTAFWRYFIVSELYQRS